MCRTFDVTNYDDYLNTNQMMASSPLGTTRRQILYALWTVPGLGDKLTGRWRSHRDTFMGWLAGEEPPLNERQAASIYPLKFQSTLGSDWNKAHSAVLEFIAGEQGPWWPSVGGRRPQTRWQPGCIRDVLVLHATDKKVAAKIDKHRTRR